MPGLTIGKLAAAEGVSVETVRFYQRRGLLPQPDRQGSGFRKYSEADRWRLAFIRRAKGLGFSLEEIGELLGLALPGAAAPAASGAAVAAAGATGDVIRAAQAKLAAIEEQLSELSLLRCRLRRLVQVCEHGSGHDCLALHVAPARVP
jgi:DNA-binding transcriptional MerR regulator